MSASPSSASRLGTKLEIHYGVATSQSNAAACPVLKQPKSQITNPTAYIAQPMLLAFAILGQPGCPSPPAEKASTRPPSRLNYPLESTMAVSAIF
jgi:hypothetical protein